MNSQYANLTQEQASELFSRAEQIHQQEKSKKGSYRTNKQFYQKYFKGIKVDNHKQKNHKRMVRRILMKLYFKEYVNRETNKNMTDKLFVKVMNKIQGFLILSNYLSNMGKTIFQVFTYKDRQNSICAQNNETELILIVLDLLKLRDMTQEYIQNPDQRESLLEKKSKKNTFEKQQSAEMEAEDNSFHEELLNDLTNQIAEIDFEEKSVRNHYYELSQFWYLNSSEEDNLSTI